MPSPTFTLVQSYAATVGGKPVEIAHFDLYRLKSPDETIELGIEDAFAEGISLVEWPDRLGACCRSIISPCGSTLRRTARRDARRCTATEDWHGRLARIVARLHRAEMTDPVRAFLAAQAGPMRSERRSPATARRAATPGCNRLAGDAC